MDISPYTAGLRGTKSITFEVTFSLSMAEKNTIEDQSYQAQNHNRGQLDLGAKAHALCVQY